MKLKICGMKYPENILEASTMLPDYMGFVFWKPSSRFFDNTLPTLPKSIKKIGVFVNDTLHEIASKITQYQLDGVQLHGNESAEFCQQLQQYNVIVIKVFSIHDDFDFAILNPYETVCDYYLFDTKGKLPGGNGVAFNWKILQKYSSKKPFFLSGGIDLQNIEAIQNLHLPIHAIDVNSGFETKPGHKDMNKLRLLQHYLNPLP